MAKNLASFLSCRLRSGPTGREVECAVCGQGRVRVPVLGCDRHGECVTDKALPGIACCRICPDRTPGERAFEFAPGCPDPIPEPEASPVPPSWKHKKEVKRRHAAALRELVARDFPDEPDSHRPDGDGIVITGGGKYAAMIALSLRLLRDTGSTLPVEVWHRGDAEEPLDGFGIETIPGVRIVDASEAARRHPPRILRGWESKTFAMLHSRFSRIFYLDADAYFLTDPRPSFAILDEPEVGFAYWEDLPNMRGNLNWNAWGYDANTCSTRVPTIQGGQILCDMRKGRKIFLLSHWLNQHSDFSYTPFGYGDQDCWRLAIAAVGFRGFRCIGPAPCLGGVFVLPEPGGTAPLVVHRCCAKIFADRPFPYRPDLPRENRVRDIFTGEVLRA